MLPRITHVCAPIGRRQKPGMIVERSRRRDGRGVDVVPEDPEKGGPAQCVAACAGCRRSGRPHLRELEQRVERQRTVTRKRRSRAMSRAPTSKERASG